MNLLIAFYAIVAVLCFFGRGTASPPPIPLSDANLKELQMAVSAAFQTALDALVAAFAAKTAAVQAELDALKAVPPVVDTGPRVDADDTAAVAAATPAS